MASSYDLFSPVTILKGVGPKTEKSLETLGVKSVYDLIYYFPFRYDDLESLPLAQLMDGQKVLLKGLVATEAFVSRFGYKKSRLSFKMRIDHEIVMVNFFNQPWLKEKIKLGEEVAIYGKFNQAKQSLSGFKFVATKEQDSGLAPVYSVNQHLRQKKLIELIDQALKIYQDQLIEVVPAKVRQQYQLLNEHDLVLQMHHPKKPRLAKLARRSAIFREFFLFQMQLMRLTRQTMQSKAGRPKRYDLKAIQELITSLPFELSADQKQVVNEIFADLHQPKQMWRLLQGDVGSGKTVVAIFAIYAIITAGYQAALMVPTEILADQHFHKISALLQPLGVRVAILTGSTKPLEKREIDRELSDGSINVVIGTQALIQEKVHFKCLGLVLIDEQHRFGVLQRQALINKGQNPDFLAMTATPIPRTLALTLYGEMMVSEIRHLPAGRKPIVSKWVTTSHLKDVLNLMKSQLEKGFQIYVVTPLIHDSEKIDLKNAETLQKNLATFFKEQTVVLLHGQMPGLQKEAIMQRFANGEISLLVTTSVIEVGVDVVNANMMVIFDADRFGLSQLHQLRGRIGRGKTQGICLFAADPKTREGKKRMSIISSTQDGFKVAQEDLKLRGEGNLFGKAQSGIPEFQVADVVTDYQSLTTARQVAIELLQRDPNLALPENKGLKVVLEYKKDHRN